MKNEQFVEETLKAAFDLYKDESSGCIEITKVAKVMAKALRDMIPDDETWSKICEEADENKDGKIECTRCRILFREEKQLARHLAEEHEEFLCGDLQLL